MYRMKKAAINELIGLVIGLIVLGMTIVISLLILAEVDANSTVAADANASLAIDEVQDAGSDVPGWLSIVVVAVVGSALIGLVMYFRGRR